jgi:uncharacterized protein (DUF433 family)
MTATVTAPATRHLSAVPPAARRPRAATSRVTLESEQIVARYLGGDTLQVIAEDYCVTRQRIHQAIRRTCPDYKERHRANTARARQARISALLAETAERHARIYDILAAYGPLSVTQLETHLGEPLQRGDAAIPAVRRMLLHTGTGPVATTPEAIEAGLQWANACAAEAGVRLSGAFYDRVRREHPDGPLISHVRIVQVYGTWTAACAAAGVEAASAGRATYTRRWTSDEAIWHVRRYLGTPAATGSYDDYDTWSRTDPDAPSAATIRTLAGLRRWSAVKTAALRLNLIAASYKGHRTWTSPRTCSRLVSGSSPLPGPTG